jgi:protein arginine kinase
VSTHEFMKQPVSAWMNTPGPEADIVISTRVRLARNLVGAPFPMLSTNQQALDVFERLEQSIAKADVQALGPFAWLTMNDLGPLEKKALVEKHLISPYLAEESRHGAAVLSENEAISVMVNEEDHLRIQCLRPGFQLIETFQTAGQVDDAVEGHLEYAFDEKCGYLTSCPTNVGTGLRASVMMHLPALVMTQQINHMVHAVTQVGLAVRGMYGEGSEAFGNLFQISNQITLGQSEEEIIHHLHHVVKQVIDHERQERERLFQANNPRTIDRIFRSLGLLSHAYMMDSKEALQRLSDVRLGVDLGYVRGIQAGALKELMVLTQPGFLQMEVGSKLTADERDMRRAQMIRQRLEQANRESS